MGKLKCLKVLNLLLLKVLNLVDQQKGQKRVKTQKLKVTRFSKLLGEIFINDSNALPPRLAISERVK